MLLGGCLQYGLGYYGSALQWFSRILELDTSHVEAMTNMAATLFCVNRQMYERAVLCDGTFDIALTNLANAVKDKGRIVDAIAYYRRALCSNPEFDEAVCGLFIALNFVCDWRGRGGVLLTSGDYDRWHVDDDGKILDARKQSGARGLAMRVVGIVAHQLRDASSWGQHTLREPVIQAVEQQLRHLCEDSSFQLVTVIRRWAGKPWEGSRLTRLLERAARVALRKCPQLNVGYLSSDFNNHPLAHLMNDGSVHRRQIEREASAFRDVSGLSPEKVLEKIGRDQIHILVNLNGYTRGARNEIFAARPAPIQMSFMGFAGSLGAEWCDYILADSTTVPPETLRPWRRNVSIEDVLNDNTECSEGQWVYSENVIFCRSTFFCCDHAQSSGQGEKILTWDGEKRRRWELRRQLFPSMPDDTVILGNFNQLYKIDPTIFRSWLRILSRVPNAILWLLRFPEPGEINLRATAESWAGPEVAKRLVFTDVAPKDQHILRARVCDLFLDTPESRRY
ncbi:putative UDP-N-acetylglucosamine--peptide N-acetylglucosaminyltransferase SEC [Ophiocordyceps camponoti-floridani]|uniref:Putative UDP-N-acetylglucosamine--peptide N-acetylglucosaminyltransferase SEC n=1 Tax=Ophiocordyceps camponoti-floridani TaxID=2030778 RepID=A0A8H4VBJ8_9HYPO|nr:putative UDP-N-acetylglucosamine--peptide N-acetylglucosaminyltransferase SEC [Ophiocordyceps camponoti-floridani]